MTYWTRETLGWLFLLLGLTLMFVSFWFIANRQVVEGGTVAIMGIVLFRAGVHFLKVAVAAAIYRKSREPKKEAAATESRRPPLSSIYRSDRAKK